LYGTNKILVGRTFTSTDPVTFISATEETTGTGETSRYGNATKTSLMFAMTFNHPFQGPFLDTNRQNNYSIRIILD